MTSMTIKVQGMMRARAFLAAKLVKQADNSAAYALYQMGLDIITEAVKITPREHSTLVRSNFVSIPKTRSGMMHCEIGFNTRYAVFVHEIPPPPAKSPKGRSARHDPPTQWKYLSTPYDAYTNNATKHFNHYVTKGMSKKVGKPNRAGKVKA